VSFSAHIYSVQHIGSVQGMCIHSTLTQTNRRLVAACVCFSCTACPQPTLLALQLARPLSQLDLGVQCTPKRPGVCSPSHQIAYVPPPLHYPPESFCMCFDSGCCFAQQDEGLCMPTRAHLPPAKAQARELHTHVGRKCPDPRLPNS
jgi:hypothetical protein